MVCINIRIHFHGCRDENYFRQNTWFVGPNSQEGTLTAEYQPSAIFLRLRQESILRRHRPKELLYVYVHYLPELGFINGGNSPLMWPGSSSLSLLALRETQSRLLMKDQRNVFIHF
jgi:hypothetical protein